MCYYYAARPRRNVSTSLSQSTIASASSNSLRRFVWIPRRGVLFSRFRLDFRIYNAFVLFTDGEEPQLREERVYTAIDGDGRRLAFNAGNSGLKASFIALFMKESAYEVHLTFFNLFTCLFSWRTSLLGRMAFTYVVCAALIVKESAYDKSTSKADYFSACLSGNLPVWMAMWHWVSDDWVSI